MIPRSLALLVSPVMFLIDHDQTEIVQRSKKGGPSTDHHLRPAFPDLVPRLPPFGYGLTAMQDT
jgi:hypothetical protein